MSYKIVKRKTKINPFKIINVQTRKIVGSSATLAKAKRSVGHRSNAELMKEEQKWRGKRRVVNK